MALKLGYDGWVKGRNWASKAVFAGFSGLLFAATALAQINAAPPSVTSMGFGGRAINGAPPSVTSIGPRGPVFNPAFPSSRPVSPNHQHHRSHSFYPLGATVYAVPIYGYGYADAGDDADNAAPDDQYNGGPTIFDRRGAGGGYRAAAPPDQSAAFADPSAPDPPPTAQPETVLVFKDGHQQEIGNYAIVGNMLYDLEGLTRRKIALSDLDIDATTKANDSRGIDFTVPPGSM